MADAASRGWGGHLVARLAASPALATGALLALTLAVYLPGVVRLPAVDRTEIVFADTTRQMVERAAWLDPRYHGEVHAFRPIGTFWAQGLAATMAGPDAARDITVYRLPGLAAVVLAVLALYWLTAPRLGRETALVAAGLFAVAPLTVLVSQLAIADGLALLPATVAMLALLRLYDAGPGAPVARLAMVFWLAMGAGMLVNALHTPILVGVTILALLVLDRDLSWLRRTRPLVGVPLALSLAAPWIAVRVVQDGVPLSTLGWQEFLAALGGAQDMKLRAFPGTFLLAALIGFLPGVALLPPAMKGLWDARGADRVARFLLAWVIGYIVYLELLSSKPGTYTVQVLFPALALAVALHVMRSKGAGESAAADHGLPPDKAGEKGPLLQRIGSAIARPLVPWPPLAALFALVLLAAVPAFTREVPPPLALLLAAAVAAMFAWSAALGRRGDLAGWAVSGVASLALFAVTLLGVVLPGTDRIWPAREIARAAAAACPGRPVSILGFREPSAAFVLGVPRTAPTPDAMPAAPPHLHVVESRWLTRYREARRGDAAQPVVLGCVEAVNVMRGCPSTFTLLASGPQDAACAPAPNLSCAKAKNQLRPSSKGCD